MTMELLIKPWVVRDDNYYFLRIRLMCRADQPQLKVN